MLRTIRSDQLRPGMYVQRLSGAWLDHPFWRRSFVADADAVKRIRDSGVPELVIDVTRGLAPDEDRPAAAMSVAAEAPGPGSAADLALPESVGARAPTASFETEVRSARQLLESGRSLVEAMFAEARLGRAIDTGAADPLVNEVCASVLRNPHALVSVARLKTADDYTYLHSMAVAGLMAALARRLGLAEAAVHAAARGGLLHDMGKAVARCMCSTSPAASPRTSTGRCGGTPRTGIAC